MGHLRANEKIIPMLLDPKKKKGRLCGRLPSVTEMDTNGRKCYEKMFGISAGILGDDAPIKNLDGNWLRPTNNTIIALGLICNIPKEGKYSR